MTGPTTQAWEDRPVALKARFGDVTVVTATLRLRTWSGHFLDASDTLPAPPPDGALAGSELDGFFLPSCPAPDPLPTYSRSGRYWRYVPRQYRRCYTDLRLSEDEYLERFSGKSRSTLKRKVRRFAELSGGAIDFRAYRTADELDTFRSLARPLSARTYQERLLGSGLPDDDGFWAALKSASAADGVRAYLLLHDGRPVAYLCCPIRNGVVLYEYVGFDAAYRQHSPGTVLQWLALKSLLAERRFRAFDFTPGEAPHKAFFATASVRCADVYYLRWTVRTVALIAAKSAIEGTATGAGLLAARLGIKARLKRLLRGG